MDVHPPHEPVHTWRDAVVHLGIVTVGLFIALSLEGLVEYVHHRHIVREARENIRRELRDNQEAARFDIAQIAPNTKRVQANIAALHIVETNPHAQPPMSYEVNFSPLHDAAWKSARDTGALGYMPYAEVVQDDELYSLQERVNEDMTTIFRRETESLGPVIAANQFTDVPLVDLQFAVRENAIAISNLYALKQLLEGLSAYYATVDKVQ